MTPQRSRKKIHVEKMLKTHTRLQYPPVHSQWLCRTKQKDQSKTRKQAKKKRSKGTCCVANSCHLPSAPRASRASWGPARPCTSAARTASSCTIAPASCRRPGSRTGRRPGRRPTPGAPACRDERPKSSAWATGRQTPPKKKTREHLITGIFPARELFFITVLNYFRKIAAGENYRHYGYILIPKQSTCNASKL